MSGSIGPLRERITIEVRTETITKGVISEVWGTHAEVWARVEFVKKGKRGEQREAQKTGTITEVNVTTRFLSTVTTKMRIVWNSQAWDIHGIRPNERKNYMEIEATEVK